MKLIIAANRSPYDIKKDEDGHSILQRNAGGLVTALDPAMKKNGGVWVCVGDKSVEAEGIKLPYPIKQIKLTQRENKHYYEGFCNAQIWPLFHYFPTRYKPTNEDWSFYKQVNQKFANKILEILEPDDEIWIHDYQLMLLPALLRGKGVKNKIGFFLHIPFPNIEIYRVFSKRMEIMQSLLCCNLVGLHTESYKKHFIESAKYLLGKEAVIDEDTITYNNNISKVIALPISIDFENFENIAKSEKVDKRLGELKINFADQRVGLGIDRLDYSKGIIEKLEGLEQFFETHPEYIKKVSFVQVAIPTRTNVTEYARLKRHTDEAVGRINGKFSRDGWSPIHYIYGCVNCEDLVAYYRLADFIVVSALRDGLNLVAKEYIASRIYNGGNLILSEFTGAAEELSHRYLINPYDTKSISDAIAKALFTSSEIDKIQEMKELRDYVRKNDIFKWLDSFLYELKKQKGANE